MSKAIGLNGRGGEVIGLRSVRARGEASGLVFEMVVEQHYLNVSEANIEAVYTFPLPPGAVLLGLELDLGGKAMRGVVAPHGKAGAQYEQALEQGNTALLVERAADGLYTVSLGNLMAGEAAMVRYRYGQLLGFVQGQLRIAVPTVIAPRYGNPLRSVAQPHQAPEVSLLARYPLELSLLLKGELAAGAVSSPSHRLSLRGGDGGLAVQLAADAVLDRDVVIAVDGLAGRPLAMAGRDGEGTVVLAGFCPQPVGELPPSPLRLKMLVDCSSSMAGDSMASAKRALHDVLAALDEQDCFTYSRFGNEVVHHAGAMCVANGPAVRQAAAWIGATEANMGGTNLPAALLSTFALDDGAPADVLLITDGETWSSAEVIAAACRGGQRVFVVGIGAAPAASLLSAVVAKTGGAVEFIAPGDSVEAPVLRCLKRLRRPQLAPRQAAWDVAPEWQWQRGAAMFYGETLHCFAGYAQGQAPRCATLAWQDGDEAREQDFTLPAAVEESDTLARIAAAMRMAAQDAETRQALALRYQLVTEATSLVVVRERAAGERAIDLPELQLVPQMLPAGWGGAGSTGAICRVAVGEIVKRPAVWRRESASEQVAVLAKAGMASYDIPAFLRKEIETAPIKQVQVYPVREGLVEFLRSWARGGSLFAAGGADWSTLAQLRGEIPEQVSDWLQALKREGHAERDLIVAFAAALQPLGDDIALQDGVRRRLRKAVLVAKARPELLCRMREKIDELLAFTEMREVPPSRPIRMWRWLFRRRQPSPLGGRQWD